MRLGRALDTLPQLYRQKKTCVAEGVTFRSEVALMQAIIRDFEPVEGTRTNILLDTWYSARVIWKAARERSFLITTGLTGNRLVRIRDKGCRAGWQWLSLDAYAMRLKDEDYKELIWPRQDGIGRTVYIPVFGTAVQKLGREQLIVVREKRNGKLTEPRFWASSDLEPTRRHL